MNTREIAEQVAALLDICYARALYLRAVDYAHKLSTVSEEPRLNRLSDAANVGALAKRNAAYVKAFIRELQSEAK
jgi:hypothetical protein